MSNSEWKEVSTKGVFDDLYGKEFNFVNLFYMERFFPWKKLNLGWNWFLNYMENDNK